MKGVTGLVQWVSVEAVSTINVGDCGGLFGGAPRAEALDLIGTASSTKAHDKVAMLGVGGGYVVFVTVFNT